MDLNTHLYVPYTIAGGDPTIFNQRILRLSIDNANHHLWIRVENQLYVAKIEEATNTLYLLEWDNNSNLSTYWTQQKPVIYEGKAWITTDKALIQLAIINQKVHIKRRYQLEDLLRQKTEISSLYASEGYLYLRSSQGCFRLPFQIMTSIPQIFLISIFTKQTLISPTTQSQLFASERTGLYGAVILAVYSKSDNPLQNTELSTNI